MTILFTKKEKGKKNDVKFFGAGIPKFLNFSKEKSRRAKKISALLPIGFDFVGGGSGFRNSAA